LIGCAIGDFGTIAVMQDSGVSVILIFALAMLNGIITSILLETYMLMRQSIRFGNAIRTALGLSLISMLSMELAMNLVDYLFTGGAIFQWSVLPIVLFFGFITPWPFNYWRLKKLGKVCH
jgi:asparagine N-glycosylation enzyme membrane subunit Stt3